MRVKEGLFFLWMVIPNAELFAVVESDAVFVRGMVAAEKLIGELAQPDTGSLFAKPVSRARGAWKAKYVREQKR